MALFKKKEKKEETQAAAAPEAKQESVGSMSPARHRHAGAVLLSPRITEKGAYIAERGVYVFNVHPKSGKKEIAAAVAKMFKVSPAKVRLAPVPRKRVKTRGTNRTGQTAGGKKAYVYLKKGDKIDIA